MPLSTSATHTLQGPYPALTDSERETTTESDTVPSLPTTVRKSSQAVTLREAVASVFLSLMILMLLMLLILLLIGILSMVTIILYIRKQRQRRDSTVTAEAAAYEMDENPCYESSKTDNIMASQLKLQQHSIL